MSIRSFVNAISTVVHSKRLARREERFTRRGEVFVRCLRYGIMARVYVGSRTIGMGVPVALHGNDKSQPASQSSQRAITGQINLANPLYLRSSQSPSPHMQITTALNRWPAGSGMSATIESGILCRKKSGIYVARNALREEKESRACGQIVRMK